MMDQFRIKEPDHVRRARRLSTFCKEIKRALFNLSLDRGVAIAKLDFFIEELFMRLEYSDSEYPTDVLLKMLVDEDFVVSAFERYLDVA